VSTCYSNNTRDPDRRRRRCFHANCTTPGLTKWCRRKQGVSCTRCCSYFSIFLRCGYNRRDPPAASLRLPSASMAHATANKKVTKVKATSHPTYKTQPLPKGRMPIRRELCTEEALPLRPGHRKRPPSRDPDRGPERPNTRFKLSRPHSWPHHGRAQSLSRLHTVGSRSVGLGHHSVVIATARRHQGANRRQHSRMGQGPCITSETAPAGVDEVGP